MVDAYNYIIRVVSILTFIYSKLSLDTYADADFAGLRGSEDPLAPESMKSRTGYVILFRSCPVYWKSKLQTLVAVSTIEAEYVALSNFM